MRGLIQGDAHQLLVEFIAASATLVYVAVGTCIIGLIVKGTLGLRAPDVVEMEGLDLGIHGESAWDIGAVPEMAAVTPANS